MYDLQPTVEIEGTAPCVTGWDQTATHLHTVIDTHLARHPRCLLALDCYPGTNQREFQAALQHRLPVTEWVTTQDLFLPPAQIEQIIAPFLRSEDPLFGYRTTLDLEAFFDSIRLEALRGRLNTLTGLIVLCGPGAALCAPPDVFIFADLPRWEIQQRQRRGETGNLGVANQGTKPSLLYKQSYFIDWPVCDRHKRQTLPLWDYLLDTTRPHDPRLLPGAALRQGLEQTARQPFRVVPFFDPAPWGGQWMNDICGLDPTVSNYGWCFDCVPEENSLRLRFGPAVVEIPALDLIFHCPQALLGDAVYGLFGPEFPIRFDLLDTWGGGNLSVQVHPPVAYALQQFGIPYTQDESYYLLDAAPGASVYLGLKPPADPDALFAALEDAQTGGTDFPVDRFVQQWPAHKHDHFLIPAGTIHCSGAGAVVLEISATPFLFTFKLWDWGRLGLDGEPRPLSLRHGQHSLCSKRDTEWVRAQLINRIQSLTEGPGWREERTGLHPREFIETRRHWFTQTVPHDTAGTVHVLNLVQGAEAVVESPDHAFAPFVVHYAETFILPAAVGPYTVRPHGPAIGTECATLKAFVRLAATQDTETHER